MPDVIDQSEEILPENNGENTSIETPKRRRFFNRRTIVKCFGVLAAILLLFSGLVALLFKTGAVSNFIKSEFNAKLDRMGIQFDGEVFDVTTFPIELRLKNAAFNNKSTGEKLFFIKDAKIGLTVLNLFAMQLSRDINLDSTDIDGAEIWLNFDDEGRSNFTNVKILDEVTAVNFSYASLGVSLKNGLVNFGDTQRKISANVNSFRVQLNPTELQNVEIPDGKGNPEFNYAFDISAIDSSFSYGEGNLESIDVSAKGTANEYGANVSSLSLSTPIGESVLTGKVNNWESPKYEFKIDSTIDLTQASTIFPLGTSIRGIGNFKGTVFGEGEKYTVEGEVFSESLAAANVRLKAIKVNATINGENSMYNANGKAVAEMLTFEDFTIDYPQIIGNVRGTGTDFRWIGELQAIAAKTPIGTIAGLFIKDAVADYKEQKFGADLGNVVARSFISPDVEVSDIRTGKVKVSNENGLTNISAPTATAGTVKTDEATSNNLKVNNLKVRDSGAVTDISADNVRAESLSTKDARLNNLTANEVKIRDTKTSTDINAKNLQADNLNSTGARIGNLSANDVNINVVGNETKVYSNSLKIAKLETDAAILGGLNVAGVRLTIRDGRIEGTSGDIDAGNVALTKSAVAEGGNLEAVKLKKPVFMLEPSGRYRASADMSLGGGILGSVKLGAARASIVAENEQVALKNLTAQVMDGTLSGDAVIALTDRRRSNIEADFENLNLSPLFALSVGLVAPIEGKTTGKIDLNFPGTNIRIASGTLTADIQANAGTKDTTLVPVNGKLGLEATDGLFNINFANLFTDKSDFSASGSFDLNGNDSNLNLALNSTDASEIERIVRAVNLLPEIEEQIDNYQAEFAGNLKFNGKLTGDLRSPTLDGHAALESLILKKRDLGTLTAQIFSAPDGLEIRNGKLAEAGGGNLTFDVNIPSFGENNITVAARLNKVNTGNLLAALPVDAFLPEQFQDFRAQTSGSLNLRGLPNQMEGDADISSGKGTIDGQPFDGFDASATFAGNLINIKNFDGRFGEGTLKANGSYQTDSKAFNFIVGGENVDLTRVRPFIPNNKDLPSFEGVVDVKGTAQGIASDSRTFRIDFNGAGRNVFVDSRPVGELRFVGKTENQVLNANITINFEEQPQIVTGFVNFADENLPFRAESVFENTELTPIIALIRPEAVQVSGRATGNVVISGNLSHIGDDGEREFTAGNFSGSADFSQFALEIEETPFAATKPIFVRFDARELVVDDAKFSGGGSNVVITGTKAFTEDGINNLSVDGKINLRVFNAVSKNSFFAGLADVAVRLTGVNKTSRLTGRAELQGASAAIFIGSERVSFDRITGLMLFTSNQAQINNLTGFMGGGRLTASGGALVEGLKLQQFRLNIRGTNITAPLPPDFTTTGDAEGEISGFREGNEMNTLIRGTFNARRSVYTKNIDVSDILSGRNSGSLSAGTVSSATSFVGVPKLDIRIEGRDALVVRNNLADLTASASLRVTGDTEFPQISGRITANRGTILFRNDRYEIQRGTVEFPPNTSIEPYINLQAETEIKGYQIVISLVGNITDTESLIATVRSNPALPQPDVISLITTGNLSNTDSGIPTLAQSGINTAAEVLTDSFINNPASRATDKLFGLNRFELDPVISGERLNPGARLTVGRQINRNLLVTYSTNLSEDQNQVLAFEYQVSNKLSFVAQYEQRSLSNVTRRNNNFSFEIRLRKRF